MRFQESTLNIPKMVSIQIVKLNSYWRIYLQGVLLKKTFRDKKSAEEYVPTLHDYFNEDSTVFYIKESQKGA